MTRLTIAVLFAVVVLGTRSGAGGPGAIAAPGAAPSGGPGQMVMEGDASVVSEYPVTLATGIPVTFETTAISFGSDPVLHLLSPAGLQVAVHDNISKLNRAARLTYKPAAGGTYRLIVRAKTCAM